MSVQFDLFLHSADVVAENELREALQARNADEALRNLNELRTHKPDHHALEPAALMLQALQAVPPYDSNTALAYRNKLEQEWVQAAKNLFDVEGQEILAPLWRAVGLALEGVPFAPEHPDHHASHAYLACGDWPSALRVTRADPGCENQPVLLARAAQALWHTDRTAQAVDHWFTLCWLAPTYFESLLENERIPASLLQEHWRQAMNTDMEPELATPWYPAWVILHEPGLARSIKSRNADAGPQRAFDLARELVTSDNENVQLRRELRNIHPGLFDYFLHNRIQFLRG